MENIILIGFMGCGKTSVGERLALKLNFTFCDTDKLIENDCKRSIRNIFENEGEEYFRSLETASLETLYGTLSQSVLSVGGGLPIREGNGALLRRLGHVVYLKSTKESILKRLKGDSARPLLAGDDIDKKVDNLLKSRTPIYESIAHITVITDDRSFDDIIEEIIIKCNI